MLESSFIGYEDELRQLRELAIRGLNSQGGTCFIEASGGIGIARILREFEQRIQRDPQLKDAFFINAECDEYSGPDNAYQPFREILENFNEPRNKNKERARTFISIIKETAPDWLAVFPIIGPAINAGVKTGAKALDIALTSRTNTSADTGILLIRQYIDTILKISSNCRLLVLVITDAQWIDAASCQLLLRLARQAQMNKIIIIVTYSPESMDEQYPLRSVRAKMEIKEIANTISLHGWSVDEIRMYLRATYGDTLNPYLAEWLHDLCNGEPWFIRQYLSLLRQSDIIQYVNGKHRFNGKISYIEGEWDVDGPLKDVLPSKSTIIDHMLNLTISSLDEEKQEILQLGALQGKRFMSAVIERLLSKKKQQIMRHLLAIEKQRQLSSRCTDEEWARRISDVYAFALHLLQVSLYNQLPESYRIINHREIAKILEGILKDVLNENTQPISSYRKLMIQIARHYDFADERLLAARYYLQAAQSTFYNGVLKETIALCERALEKIRLLRMRLTMTDCMQK